MIKHIYDKAGKVLLRQVEAEPVCGVHFCDSCGDCLHCYSEDQCSGSNVHHFWVQYGDEPHGDSE